MPRAVISLRGGMDLGWKESSLPCSWLTPSCSHHLASHLALGRAACSRDVLPGCVEGDATWAGNWQEALV